MTYSTAQETFWEGAFGDDYHRRCLGDHVIASKTALIARALSRTHGVNSIIEFGAGIGLNMRAFKTLLPKASLRAIEINPTGFAELQTIDRVSASRGSLLDFKERDIADLSFTSGVLIHIDPAEIARAYDVLFYSARRYVLDHRILQPIPCRSALPRTRRTPV